MQINKPYKVFKSVLNQFDPCRAYLLIFMDEDPLQESEIPVLYLMVCNIDSLHYSVSTSNTELHRLLLDCNETEQEIIIRTARELKATLVSLGIQHPSVLKSQNKKARISRRRTLESTWVLSVVYSSFSYNSFSVF